MQAGTLAGGDVQAFSTRIMVAGVERSGVWSMGRELIGDLPEQVTALSGVKQATGNVLWAQTQDVSDRAENPWNRAGAWPPMSGDPVEIYVSDGVTEWRVFTGVIDETTGDVGSGFSSSLIDATDKLNVPFELDPILRVMPPVADGAADYRGVGLASLYVTNEALRAAGFFTTPKLESNPALSVPAQGSMWPEGGNAGTMTLGGGYTAGVTHAINFGAPWGWSVGDFNCTYNPRLQNASSVPVQLSFLVAPDHAGVGHLTAYYGSSWVRLQVTSTHAASVIVGGSTVATLSGADMAGATAVQALFKAGTVTLKNDTGKTSSGAYTIAAVNMSSVTLVGDANARLAGFQVSHPTTATQEFAAIGHVPSAVMSAGVTTGLIDASPTIVSTARDILDEISDATLAPYWIDEHGVLRWVESWYLLQAGPVQTITTLDDVFSLSWSDSWRSVRSKVRTKYRALAIDKGRFRNVLLYQGSSETMESGQEKSEFIGPSADEDWIMPDTVPGNVATNPSGFNTGRGSWFGGVYTVDGEADQWATDYLTFSLSKIDPDTYRIKHTVGTLPADSKLMLQTTNAASSTLWPKFREFALPVFRGFGKVQKTDSYITSVHVGPAGAAVLEHDSGPWNSRETDTTILQRVVDLIGEKVTKPSPTITGMRVGFDPRRQLGDVIRIRSERLLGVEIKALIVGINNQAGDRYEQTLAVRVMDVTSIYTTYEQFAEAWGPIDTYDDFATAWGAVSTYNDFAADPLRGTS